MGKKWIEALTVIFCGEWTPPFFYVFLYVLEVKILILQYQQKWGSIKKSYQESENTHCTPYHTLRLCQWHERNGKNWIAPIMLNKRNLQRSRPTLLCLLPCWLPSNEKWDSMDKEAFNSFHPKIFFYIETLRCLPSGSTIRYRRDVTKFFISSH